MDLQAIQGWAFDLDGVIWAGHTLLPGAAEFVAKVRRAGKQVVFLSNNSMATAEGLAGRLAGHGIPAVPRDVISPIGTAGHYLMERYGPVKVLAAGIPDLAIALRAVGHTPVDDPRAAEAVVFGRMPDFRYEHLVTICRAVDRGVPFLALNNDPRLPVEGGGWLPGLGALVAAVAAATGRQPQVMGKPGPFLFRTALEQMGTRPQESAMVGDTPEADIAGGLAAGMWTVQVGPATGGPQAHRRVRDLAELADLAAAV